jgi:pilus assembly protein CpaB
MRGKSLALLILALGCGLVASLGITQVLAKRGDQAAPADTLPVFVAKADIPQGALAGADFLKLEQWPKDKIPPGALTRQEDVDNRRARYRIFAGQPLLEPMLLHAGEVPLDAQIPKGMRVVAIPIGPEAIHSGLVVPGARCDIQVFMRADPSIGIGETVAKTILQDIRVFAVNDITNMQQSNDPKTPDAPHTLPAGKTVSLLVTPAQSSIVTLASQLGTIRLILRSGDDSEQTKNKELSARELLGGIGSTNREMEGQKKSDDEGFDKWFHLVKSALETANTSKNTNNKNKQTRSQPEEPAHFTMRCRAGENVNDVILTANAGSNGFVDDGSWTATNLPTLSKPAVDAHVPVSTNVSPVAAPTGGTATTTGGTATKQPSDATSPAPKTNVKPPMGN